jgi:8-oxo-dGTP pyrophosphatase MutT (NUDIX family)
VRRGEGGIHAGQLAFPGGKRELADASLLDTALRETNEEIGIAADAIEVLEALPAVETMTTGFLIFPFLARIVPPRVWSPREGEIAEVIEVKVRDLGRPEAHGEEVACFPGASEPQRIAFYQVGSFRLWGVTYRILQPLLPRLLAGAWAV